MRVDGLRRDRQSTADRAVGQSVGDEVEHRDARAGSRGSPVSGAGRSAAASPTTARSRLDDGRRKSPGGRSVSAGRSARSASAAGPRQARRSPWLIQAVGHGHRAVQARVETGDPAVVTAAVAGARGARQAVSASTASDGNPAQHALRVVRVQSHLLPLARRSAGRPSSRCREETATFPTSATSPASRTRADVVLRRAARELGAAARRDRRPLWLWPGSTATSRRPAGRRRSSTVSTCRPARSCGQRLGLCTRGAPAIVRLDGSRSAGVPPCARTAVQRPGVQGAAGAGAQAPGDVVGVERRRPGGRGCARPATSGPRGAGRRRRRGPGGPLPSYLSKTWPSAGDHVSGEGRARGDHPGDLAAGHLVLADDRRGARTMKAAQRRGLPGRCTRAAAAAKEVRQVRAGRRRRTRR